MMDKPLISIVVPVYNVEKYLGICVDSLINQTYKNIQIILVDDGSNDSSGDLCDQMQFVDSRIMVIHKINGGLSDARNIGTKAAKGNFITYVDSDDWVALNMVESLYQVLNENDADISICDFCKLKSARYKPVNNKNKGKTKKYSGIDALEEMLYQTSFDNSAWGKLYRTEVMLRHPYPTGRLFEDLYVTFKVMAEAKRVVFVSDGLYFYRDNTESIMHSHFNPRMFDEIDAADQIVHYVESNFPAIRSAAYSRKFSAYSQVLRWIPQNCTDESILKEKERIWDYIICYRKKMLMDTRARKKNRLAAAATLLGREIFCKLR